MDNITKRAITMTENILKALGREDDRMKTLIEVYVRDELRSVVHNSFKEELNSIENS